MRDVPVRQKRDKCHIVVLMVLLVFGSAPATLIILNYVNERQSFTLFAAMNENANFFKLGEVDKV